MQSEMRRNVRPGLSAVRQQLRFAFNQPLGGNQMPRFGGFATMMRLPVPANQLEANAKDLDVCFVGVPMDIGTSNRAGTRYGPRAIRAESCLIRPYNMATRAAPFDSLRVGDIGDVPINTFNLKASVDIISRFYSERVLAHNAVPLTMGGDHTIVLPILRAMKQKYGPVGLVHVDAHSDINDTMFGEKLAHGTPFRRAVEEGLIDPKRTYQIGLRGSGYAPDDFDWGRKQGFRVHPVEGLWNRSLAPLMAEVRAHLGTTAPVYVSFDIDSLDPSQAPGTGTPEVGGLMTWQGLEIIRGLRGLKIVGGDLVEVSPPYDVSGNTALLGANLLFEMLCVLPGVNYHS